MGLIPKILFGGMTETDLKDLTKAKDLPGFVLTATDKLADALYQKEPEVRRPDLHAGGLFQNGWIAYSGRRQALQSAGTGDLDAFDAPRRPTRGHAV